MYKNIPNKKEVTILPNITINTIIDSRTSTEKSSLGRKKISDSYYTMRACPLPSLFLVKLIINGSVPVGLGHCDRYAFEHTHRCPSSQHHTNLKHLRSNSINLMTFTCSRRRIFGCELAWFMC